MLFVVTPKKYCRLSKKLNTEKYSLKRIYD